MERSSDSLLLELRHEHEPSSPAFNTDADRRVAAPKPAPLPGGHRHCDVDALASALSNTSLHASLMMKVSAVARRRYGMHATDAEDVFQDGVVTYLLVRSRYPADANHFGLLFGICRRKALKSVTQRRRRTRQLERLAVRLSHERRGPVASDAPDWAALRCERDAAIRGAVAALPREARETLLSIAGGTERRVDVIARLGINRNTFDSRLHVARKAFRRDLAQRGGF